MEKGHQRERCRKWISATLFSIEVKAQRWAMLGKEVENKVNVNKADDSVTIIHES